MISGNRKAFLDMLAFSEGTRSTQHPLTKMDGYDVIVSGVDGYEVFTDFKEHPFAHRTPKQINDHGLYSTAAGRYQFLVRDWLHYKNALGLLDFGPASQDLWAIQLIRECCALPFIDAGNFDSAVAAVAHLWASLPGANYPGQRMRALDRIKEAYVNAGGTVA